MFRNSLKSLLMVGAGIAAPAIAARLSRSVAGKAYQRVTHGPPPKNPAHPAVSWRDAVVWTLASAAVGGLARLAARRLMAGRLPAQGYDLDSEIRKLD